MKVERKFTARERRWLRVLVAVVIVALTFGAGVFAHRFVPERTALAKSESLVHSHEFGEAEHVLWNELDQGRATVPVFVAFLENHHTQQVLIEEGLRVGDSFAVPEDQVEAILERGDIDPNVRTLARFWRGVLDKNVPLELRGRVIELATHDPPAPFANRLLGHEEHRLGRLGEAALHLEREGLAFPERREDLSEAMGLFALTDDWDEIGKRVLDPAIGPKLPSSIRYAYAVRVKNVPLALRAMLDTALAPRPLGPLALASVSGFMWLLFAMRMGRASANRRRRIPLYLTALVLGVLSVLPTLLLVGVEESVLHFRERGELVSDLIFFTVGVGLREEMCKILLFLPLLPFLRKGGSRIEVLTCGALVGLGFATEENIGYLQGGLATALARFLTANFLHIALTGILAVAVFDLARDPEEGAPQFSRRFFTVIAMHGAYDFFLSNPQVEGMSFLSMTIFVLLTRMFMGELRQAAIGPGAPLMPRFIQAVAVVTCASFVYASAFVGPVAAAIVLAEGFLGMGLIVIMFVQEIRRS